MKLTDEEKTIVQEALPHLRGLVTLMNSSKTITKNKPKELVQVERLLGILGDGIRR